MAKAPNKNSNRARETVQGAHMRAGEARQKEADHRIANGIQFAAALLRHESRQITSIAAARGALIKAANRLSAIAHMHRQFSTIQPDRKVNLAEFIAPFCEDLCRSIGAIVNVETDTVTLRADVAGQICIILNELATNAVKHNGHDGGPITLMLKVVRNGSDRLRLTVRDNGSGLPDGFSLQDANGLGMTIVTSTVEKLGGSIRIMPGKGAGFDIDLPQDGGTKRITSQREKAS